MIGSLAFGAFTKHFVEPVDGGPDEGWVQEREVLMTMSSSVRDSPQMNAAIA